MASNKSCTRDLIIHNVHLSIGDRNQSLQQRFTVRCRGGVIESIFPFSDAHGYTYNADDYISLDGKGGILIPSYVKTSIFPVIVPSSCIHFGDAKS